MKRKINGKPLSKTECDIASALFLETESLRNCRELASRFFDLLKLLDTMPSGKKAEKIISRMVKLQNEFRISRDISAFHAERALMFAKSMPKRRRRK